MRIGRVLGSVTLSQQQASYRGGRWLVVRPLNGAGLQDPTASTAPSLIVYDDLGAGVDDLIGYVEGGEASIPFSQPTPIDAYNAAIFDTLTYQPQFSENKADSKV